MFVRIIKKMITVEITEKEFVIQKVLKEAHRLRAMPCLLNHRHSVILSLYLQYTTQKHYVLYMQADIAADCQTSSSEKNRKAVLMPAVQNKRILDDFLSECSAKETGNKPRTI